MTMVADESCANVLFCNKMYKKSLKFSNPKNNNVPDTIEKKNMYIYSNISLSILCSMCKLYLTITYCVK